MTQRPTDTRQSWTDSLKRDLTHFHAATGMEYTVICNRAVKNPRIWERMQNGGTITVELADRIYEWMEAQGYYFNPNGDCYVFITS